MSTEAKWIAQGSGIRSLPFRIALSAGLVAGLAAWAVGEAFVGRIGLPGHLIGKMGADAEVIRLMAEAQARRATIAYTALGGALGLALGLAGGLKRRSVPAGLSIAAAVGIIAGAGAGLAASLALLPIFDRLGVDASDNLIVPLLLHGGLAAAIGAAGGLAYGFGLNGTGGWRLLRPLLGGLVGALLGAFAFEMAGAIALPASGTSRSIAMTTVARLLAVLSIALPAALGAERAIPPLTDAVTD
jgi:hypothetical protein